MLELTRSEIYSPGAPIQDSPNLTANFKLTK
jgi:hypothetical protein